ncbi:uncharacterized protein LOC119069173 isoform X1 [Bradysia coprophila]|uniref:uncharacterized protein LOC119069173 isoform X1 n=1 Tax=Bradysia coprophila TaxID=38358 RepID=UPI00187D9A30|nr:uncharacterized protein LOC119069173 isoform X1 [Bradysia coprophila]
MSLVQSFENRDPQEAMVLVHNDSLERIFSVQLTNGNSADVKPYLDMPLLVETNENEVFLNASVTSVEDACNNPHAINYLQNNFIAPNRVNIKEEDLSTHMLDDQQLEISESRQYSSFDETSTDSSSTSVSEDDVSDSLSKYLIFHQKKRDQNDDSQLCYVMLQKLSESEIQKWTKPAMRDGESAPKRPRLQSMYVPSTKKKEPIQFSENTRTLRVSRSSSRNALKFEDISNHRAVNKQSNVTGEEIVKRTGKNLTILSSATEQDRLNTRSTPASRVSRRNTKMKINPDTDSAVHTTNQQSADDGVTGRPKIILLFVRDRESGQFNCYRFPERRKKCYVPIERLSTLRSAAPRNKTPRRDCVPPLDLKENFVTSRRGKEEQSNGAINDIPTLVFQETNTNFEDLGKIDISSSISLAPDVTGAHTSPLAYGNRNVDSWTLGEKSCPTVEQRNFADNLSESVLRNERKEETSSLYDDIEALDFATTNFEDSTTMDKLVVESSDSETRSLNEVPLDNEMPEEPMMPTCVQNEKAGSFVEVIDDNCSIASDISLFASDSETLYSPDRNKSMKPTDGWKLENYRIPKKPAVQKKPSEKSLDKQVEQILRMTTKNLPKMTSPIKEQPIVSGTKRKRKEFRNGKTNAAKESRKSAKPRKSIQQTGKQTHPQPSSVESNANTVPLEMGSDYDVKRKKQPNKIRETGMLDRKPMEPEKTIKSTEQFNELQDICMLEGVSIEPEKTIKSAEQFNELQDIYILKEISMEPETTTEIEEQLNELRDICMLEGIAMEPEDTTKVTKEINELQDDGMLEEAISTEPEDTITTAERQTDLQLSASASNRIACIGDASEHRSSKEPPELNQSEHPSESNAPLENIAEMISKIDTSQPVNGMKYRSKIDFKNLGKVTINAGNLNSSRIVSIPNANPPVLRHSEPPFSHQSAELEPFIEQVNIVPVHSTPPRFQPSLEQPLITRSAPIAINSVENSQSAQRAASEALDEMQSVPGQFAATKPLIVESVPTPIDSVQNVVSQPAQIAALDVLHRMHTVSAQKSSVAEPFIVQSVPTPIDSVENLVAHSGQSIHNKLVIPEQSQGMQSMPILSTPLQFQSSPESLLTLKPMSIPQPMNSFQKVVTHSQTAMLTAPEHLYRMQSVPIQSAPPQFQPSLKQPSITQSLPMPQPTNWFAESMITSSPTQWSDYWQSDDVRHRYIVATLKLFEHPCINFLANKPCAVPISCPYNHQLPNSDKILSKMHTYSNDKIQFIYQTFITKSLPTFTLYFPWVCCLLGIRKMDETLLSSVSYCDKYGKYDFYRYIFGGLMMSGKSDKEALGIMVDFVDICEENFAAFYEIMKNPINPFLC